MELVTLNSDLRSVECSLIWAVCKCGLAVKIIFLTVWRCSLKRSLSTVSLVDLKWRSNWRRTCLASSISVLIQGASGSIVRVFVFNGAYSSRSLDIVLLYWSTNPRSVTHVCRSSSIQFNCRVVNGTDFSVRNVIAWESWLSYCERGLDEVVITNQLFDRSALHTCIRPRYANIQHMSTLMGWILHMLNHVERFQYISKMCGVGVIRVLEMEVGISCQNEMTWYTSISLQQVTELTKEHSCRKSIYLEGRWSLDHDNMNASFPERESCLQSFEWAMFLWWCHNNYFNGGFVEEGMTTSSPPGTPGNMQELVPRWSK